MTTVKNGTDRLDEADKYLRGQRIALLTNASGVNKQGIPTCDIIAERYELRLLLAPEHGIRSNLQDGGWGADNFDRETGARLFSMRSKGIDDIDDLLSDIDVVVYDIQDVGARFYTYLYNLTEVLRRCAKLNRSVLVLDRINPISGAITQGVMLNETKYSSFIGEYAIPTRYALTVGEFARYINAEKGIGARLDVISCEGWRRELYADQTDLLWVNPSPNIPSVSSAINYIGTCVFEATNISEGRGTTQPFGVVGAPFVNSKKLYDELTSVAHDGVVFRRTYFTPQFNKHAGMLCEGVELHITDRAAYDPLAVSLNILRHMRNYPEFSCRENGLCLRFGTDFILGNIDPDEYRRTSDTECRQFLRHAKQYYLYE